MKKLNIIILTALLFIVPATASSFSIMCCDETFQVLPGYDPITRDPIKEPERRTYRYHVQKASYERTVESKPKSYFQEFKRKLKPKPVKVAKAKPVKTVKPTMTDENPSWIPWKGKRGNEVEDDTVEDIQDNSVNERTPTTPIGE